MNIDKIIKTNDLVENIKSAILSNIIITIRDEDTNELLWSCHTGESSGKFRKMNLEIDQDIKLNALLRSLKEVLK